MKEQLNLAILKFKTRNLFSCLIDLEKVKQNAKLLGLKDIQVVSNLYKILILIEEGILQKPLKIIKSKFFLIKYFFIELEDNIMNMSVKIQAFFYYVKTIFLINLSNGFEKCT